MRRALAGRPRGAARPLGQGGLCDPGLPVPVMLATSWMGYQVDGALAPPGAFEAMPSFQVLFALGAGVLLTGFLASDANQSAGLGMREQAVIKPEGR